MLNYEEEIKKFQPSLEVEDIEDAVYQEDLTDMTDIIREVVEQTREQERNLWIIQRNSYTSRITGIMTV